MCSKIAASLCIIIGHTEMYVQLTTSRKFHYYCKVSCIMAVIMDDFSGDAMLHVSDIMNI